ncbi:MAG: bifunctional folylpolyglutamate synthase/dihydrofolate synthase [Nitrospiraceae bacterium]|nr:bifunctional folylpolyglutamate synthase/dihydrofolate synthase [Nitrospiraceae bacterium]
MDKNQKGLTDQKYPEVLRYLYGLQKFGIKLGLQNIRALLLALGNPERGIKFIHVAGTNGKGSTSAAIASILNAAGEKTGLFTSPHLLNFTERMRIGGEEVQAEKVVELAGEVKKAIERTKDLEDMDPTFFEFVTAMALLWFKQEAVGWAVLETGMGGRLDSTNIITPEVSVITTVGMDHREFLGGTIKEIAAEKAGIIKKGAPVILGPQTPEALKLLEEHFFSVNKGSTLPPFLLYGRDFNSALKSSTGTEVTFDYSGSFFPSEGFSLSFPLAGDYQIINAAVAAEAACAAGFGGEDKNKKIIREGLRLTNLPGRLELIEQFPEIRLDGAHNPEAAEALAKTLGKVFLTEGRRLILVIGIMGDKDMDGIMAPLLPLAEGAKGKIIFTAPAYGRAAVPEKLRNRAIQMGLGKESITASSVAEAVKEARSCARPEDLILITGSFYTAGEAKEVLKQQQGKFSRLRETR